MRRMLCLLTALVLVFSIPIASWAQEDETAIENTQNEDDNNEKNGDLNNNRTFQSTSENTGGEGDRSEAGKDSIGSTDVVSPPPEPGTGNGGGSSIRPPISGGGGSSSQGTSAESPDGVFIIGTYYYITNSEDHVQLVETSQEVTGKSAIYFPLYAYDEFSEKFSYVTKSDAVKNIAITSDLNRQISASVVQKKSFDDNDNPQYSYFLRVSVAESLMVSNYMGTPAKGTIRLQKTAPEEYAFNLSLDIDQILFRYPAFGKEDTVIEATPKLYFPTSDETVRFSFSELDGFFTKGSNDAYLEVDMTGQEPLLMSLEALYNANVANLFPTANMGFINGNGARFKNPAKLFMPIVPWHADEFIYLYAATGGNAPSQYSYVVSISREGAEAGYYLNTNVLGWYALSDRTVGLPYIVQTGGGGGGGGNRGGWSNRTVVAAPTIPTAVPLTSEKASTVIKQAISSRAGGASISAQLTNISTVSAEVIKQMADEAAKAGLRATLYFDTLSAQGQIATRVYIDPSQYTRAFNVAARFDDAAVAAAKATFTKFYSNKMAFVQLGQEGAFENTVHIASKVDVSGMDTTKLVFYAYDAKTNKFQRIEEPKYSIDATGFLHFYTATGGTIVISEGTLIRK